MSRIYLPEDASKARVRAAEDARRNRAEIVKAHSWGQVSRRDLVKWGLFTTAGLLAPIGGLNPFVGSARADGGSSIPTGAPRSPLFGATAFSQPMARFDVLPRLRRRGHEPGAARRCRTRRSQPVPAELGGGIGARSKGGRRATSGRTSASTSSRRRSRARRCRRARRRTRVQPRRAVEPELGHRREPVDPAALPPEHADPGHQLGVDLQRDDAAEAGAGPLRRADHVPAPQRAARRRDAEQRLRPPHDLDARAQRPPRRGERRLHRARTSSRASSTTTTGRSCSRATTRSTPGRPTRGPARPTAAAGSTTSRATGTRR